MPTYNRRHLRLENVKEYADISVQGSETYARRDRHETYADSYTSRPYRNRVLCDPNGMREYTLCGYIADTLASPQNGVYRVNTSIRKETCDRAEWETI